MPLQLINIVGLVAGTGLSVGLLGDCNIVLNDGQKVEWSLLKVNVYPFNSLLECFWILNV